MGGAGETGGVAGTGGVGVGADPNAAGLHPLRLLTRREYLNTVADLLGGSSIQPSALPVDQDNPRSGVAFHASRTVGTSEALLYRDAAETLAQNAVAHIDALLPCAGAATSNAAEATCLNTFLGPSGLAERMFRRPLTTTATVGDVARLTALITAARAAPLSLSFADAVGLVVEAVLQSAEFLYHWELDPGALATEGAVVKVGNYEMANRLSYLLWGTMPDATLFAAAAAGQLGDVAGVEAQVRRMLKDDRAGGAFGDFFTDWLDIDTLADQPKDPATYPTYNQALAAVMAVEVQSFVNAVMVHGTGHFDELMTGTVSFADQALATLYGITGVTGSTLQGIALDPAQRSGLLTLAGFLSVTGAAAGSDPPRRGRAIYERLLCGHLPDPPPDMPAVDAPTPAGGTTRQRFERQGAMPCATACHSIIDPLGSAFENYDGIGAYRTTDNGTPIDASVSVTLDGRPLSVGNALGLVAALAASDEVQTCFARQWLRYGLGRLDTPQDLASISASVRAFKDGLGDVRELVVGLATSRTFRYRTPGTGEALQ